MSRKKSVGFSPAATLFGDFELPKIRTYRIPYVGSKNAIASQVIGAILSNTVNHGNRRFVDGFCGGGAIMYGVHQTRMFRGILGNDLNKPMMELHRDLPDLDLDYIARTPCILRPNAEVQERYPFVKLIDEIEPRYQMAFRIVYSFGNNCKDNLWGGDLIVKYNLGRLLMFEPESLAQAVAEFVGSDVVIPFTYRGGSFIQRYEDYKRHVRLYRNEPMYRQLERLEQLERLQQLERLEHSIGFSSVGYDQIEYGPDDVVYFDPPYRSMKTDDYHGIAFDNDAFEEFARSLKCPVFISEYATEIKGFTPVMKVGKLSTMNNKGSSKEDKQRVEYLHWNGVL